MALIDELKVKVFADGANVEGMAALAESPRIKGFTTNPTLMRAAGITDYEAFARSVLERLPEHPISFEVFADEFDEMERQARKIAAWGPNVFVKIPVTNTRREPANHLIERLAADRVQLNITALLTLDQVRSVSASLADSPPCFISVFAGRIADAGCDPVPLMREAVRIMSPHPQQELIWASPREILNIVQADQVGCHVITVTHDLLKKLSILGRDLADYSLDTVRMFHSDAEAAGFAL